MFLFIGSYAFAPYVGAVFGGPMVNEANARIKADNRRRKIQQRIGLALLCLGFVVQAVGVFV